MGIATARSANRNVWHFAALIAGNAALAMGPWFVRMSDTGPVAAGFWRLALAMPVLGVIALSSGQRLGGYARPVWLAIAGAGLFFAMDLGSWHFGIVRTRMANATLFGNVGSLVVMVSGLIALRRWPMPREWTAFTLALGGALILMGRSLELSRTTFIGDLFCIAAGLLYAGYILLLKGPRRTMGQWALVFWCSLVGAPVLLAVATLLGERILPDQWWPLVGLALCSQIVGQGLLIYSLRHFSALVFGLALLCQPAIAVAVGWLAFGEALGWADVIGMLMVGGALVLARGVDSGDD